jgi:hypothetical protein
MALPPFMKKAGPPAATSSKGAVSFLSGKNAGDEESPEHEAAESPEFEGGEEDSSLKAEVEKLIAAHGLEAVKGAVEECGEAAPATDAMSDDAGATDEYK